MAISAATINALGVAMAGQASAQEVGVALNKADAHAAQSPVCVAAMITATNVSQTVDFGALKVGDQVLMIPATAGNADAIGPIATAGTLGQAAVVGNVYLVLRALVLPAAAAALPSF